MNIRINKKELQIAFLFIFLSRTIKIALFSYPQLSTFYTMMSRVVAVGCIAILILKYSKLLLKFKYYYVLLFALYLGVITVVSGGNIRRCVMSLYPIIAMCAFVLMNCSTIEKTKRFIHSIAWLFTILATINAILLFTFPNLFGKRYFLGIENQIGYPLVVGFLFAYLNKHYNNNNNLFIVYSVTYFMTILRIFSASNVLGAIILALFLFAVPVKKYLQNNRLILFGFIFVAVFFSLVILSSDVLLNVPFIKFIIQNVLGKSLTLSSRTYIWREAVSQIKNSPFFGYGIGDTYNLFHLELYFFDQVPLIGSFSAHNQWLQGLYEMGIIGVLLIVLMFFAADRLFQKEKDKNISGIFRVIIIVLMIMFMAESPGWNSFICVMYFGCVLCVTLNNDTEHNQALTLQKKYSRLFNRV